MDGNIILFLTLTLNRATTIVAPIATTGILQEYNTNINWEERIA